MILSVYAVYDQASKAYTQPFLFQRDAMAIRAFTEVANNKSHPIGQYPGDHSLFVLGSFNDNSGEFMNQKPGPRMLCSALSVLKGASDPGSEPLPFEKQEAV